LGPGRPVLERHFDIQREGTRPAQRRQTRNSSQTAGPQVDPRAGPEFASQNAENQPFKLRRNLVPLVADFLRPLPRQHLAKLLKSFFNPLRRSFRHSCHLRLGWFPSTRTIILLEEELPTLIRPFSRWSAASA